MTPQVWWLHGGPRPLGRRHRPTVSHSQTDYATLLPSAPELLGVAGGSRSSVIALRSDGTAADLGLKREFFEFRTSNFEIFPSLPPLPPEPLAPCLGSSGDAAAPDSPAEPSVPTASGGAWKGFNGWRKPGLPPGVLPPHSAVQGSRLSGPSQGRHATGPTLPPPALSTGLHLHPPRPHRSGGSTVGLCCSLISPQAKHVAKNATTSTCPKVITGGAPPPPPDHPEPPAGLPCQAHPTQPPSVPSAAAPGYMAKVSPPLPLRQCV